MQKELAMDNLERFYFVLWAKDRYPTFTTDPAVYELALKEYLKAAQAG
jgi:hypothetical protein